MTQTQRRIAEELGVNPHPNIAREIRRRVEFLVDYAKSIPPVKGFVLGISGGQDSSLGGRICQLAAEQLRADGNESEFVAVRLPYGRQHDEDDAQLALQFIQADHELTVDVQPSVDAMVHAANRSLSDAGLDAAISDFNKGNIKARARMIAQYAIAGERALLVVGTDHAAEALTGFFTKFGDGAADIMPLAGLTKSQGAAMLKTLGAPERLWEKIPTADLLDGVPGQTDESSLGVTYAQIDAYLAGEPVSSAVQDNLERKYLASQHKRHLPATPNDEWWHVSSQA